MLIDRRALPPTRVSCGSARSPSTTPETLTPGTGSCSIETAVTTSIASVSHSRNTPPSPVSASGGVAGHATGASGSIVDRAVCS
jgi:hypothetical protein